jgi:hypothetical protein
MPAAPAPGRSPPAREGAGAGVPRSLTGLGMGSVEEIVDGAFVLYRRRFLACFAAMSVVQVPVTAGLTVLTEAAVRRIHEAGADVDLLSQGITYALVVVLPSALLSLVATQIGTGAITYLVGKACLGETVGVVESYRWALRKAMPLVGTAAIVGFACVFGFFLFVVPAVIAFLVSFAAVPAVMLEDKGVMDGIRRSYELATGSLGRVAGVRLVVALFLGACLLIGYSIAGSLTDRPDARMLLAQVPTLVAGPVDAVSMVLLYFDLRVRREGMDIETMARALEAR